MDGMQRVPFSTHNLLTQWQFAPFGLLVLGLVIVAAGLYLERDWKLAAMGRRWRGRRTLSFMLGLIAVDLALQSPISSMTGTYFQAHIVQHLLLMVVGPPLLAMGAPMTLALQTSSRRTKTLLLRVLHSRAFKLITHPLPVFFLYYCAMFAFFLSSALGFAMEHMWVMDLVNISFFGASTLFWWPIVGIDPIPHWKMGYGARMGNLIIGIPVESFLGLALLEDSKTAAPMYTLAGTHAGGGLLWVGAEFFTMLALIPVFVQWMRADEREAKRFDAIEDARELGVTLAEAEDQDAHSVPKRRSAWLPPSRLEEPVNT
jgi:putative membrane protein